jgi:hypothetical protein
MWHLATYQSVTLFSLRPANATTAGGKTLVTPTPYALKMALLNAVFRVYGIEQAEALFSRLRDLQVAARLPDALLVIGTFQRILRPQKKEDPLGTGLDSVWQTNIAFREYVHFSGPFTVAVREPTSIECPLPWDNLFSQINYLGKRGGFVQLVDYEVMDSIPFDGESDFTWLNPDTTDALPLDGLLQLLDDCGPEMTFAHANIYDPKRLQINQPDGRLLKTVVLPYRMHTTARGFTLYRRISA